MNELLISGVALDLSPDTVILPSFQANDLTKPDTIQSDFSPEFSVPGTSRNHQLLGQAAYAGTAAGVPYRKLSAVLLSDGVEIMPRALLIVKGYQEGRYQVQLFAGNLRFIQQLGDKTIQDLDLSRFTHNWTIDAVAQRLPLSYWQANGWGYELCDRGKPIAVDSLSPFLCLPSVSVRLLWEQMLQEAGFSASDLSADVLYSRLNVPAPTVAGYPKGFLEARKLVAGHAQQPAVPQRRAATRDPLEFPVPFTFHPAGTDPYRVPTVAGVLQERQFSGNGEAYAYTVYKVDTACLLTMEARTNVDFDVEVGRARAKLILYKNGQFWLDGAWQEVGASGPHLVTPTITASREALQPGDEVHAVLRLEGASTFPAKWGFYTGLFSGQQWSPETPMPLDQFSVELVGEVPPGGRIVLQEWLPPIKQVDFFKALVQVLGLTVQCDPYADHLHLGFSVAVLDNTTRAVDWTAKRDAPAGPAGQPRAVAFRFGSYGRQNWLRWTDDDSLTLGFGGVPRKSVFNDTLVTGYGDGHLAVEDANLPAEAALGTLPFAASEPSVALAGAVKIPSWKRSEGGEYELQQVAARLTVRAGAPLSVVLSHKDQRRTVQTVLSYFADAAAEVELDLHRCILPRYWRGLAAMLREARLLKERYRLTQADIARLDYTVPVYDAVLGDFFAISRVSEFSPTRPTEVELVRLHPSLLSAPAGPRVIGQEFYEEEFLLLPPTPEFY